MGTAPQASTSKKQTNSDNAKPKNIKMEKPKPVKPKMSKSKKWRPQINPKVWIKSQFYISDKNEQ